jgi:rhomboid family protein
MFPLRDNIPTRRFPVLTVMLIVVNVLAFFLFQHASLSFSGATVDDRVTVAYGAIPYELSHPGSHCELSQGHVVCEGQKGVQGEADPQPATLLTVLTSMFMHGGLLHLGFNMLFLWIFGNNIEDSMSRWRFVLFYLIGGAVAVLLQTLVDPGSAAPTIGASGAIAAVLGGYALLYPRATVHTLIFIIVFVTVIELPALVMLGLWIAIQLVLGFGELGTQVGGGGVAYFAHIGGFVFGLAAIRIFANRPHRNYLAEMRTAIY